MHAAPLPERPVVTRLVAEDNRDREALYTEIARANGVGPKLAGRIVAEGPPAAVAH